MVQRHLEDFRQRRPGDEGRHQEFVGVKGEADDGHDDDEPFSEGELFTRGNSVVHGARFMAKPGQARQGNNTCSYHCGCLT